MGTRDPERHQTKKGNQYQVGMKAHIVVYADAGEVDAVSTTAANDHDPTQAHAPLHGKETDVFADSRYRGVDKREEVQDKEHQPDWKLAKITRQAQSAEPRA